MAWNREKIVRNICTGLYFFLSGVEYAVIIPTLNGFLMSLDAEVAFLGIVMSSFSFTGLIAAPIYGRITDKTRSTKLCVIIGNLFEIVGNFMYFISSNKYLVWGSRLVAGTGSGASSSIFGMISRTTTQEERTSVFSQLMALRQIGLIIGPGFNVFLSKINFSIGPFAVNQFTSPGLLMVILWVLHTLLLIFFFKDTDRLNHIVNEEGSSVGSPGYEEIGEEPGFRSRSNTFLGSRKPIRGFLKEFLREEVIVCLAITFMMMFSQTGLEAVVTPLTLIYFNWGGLYNSLLFCGAGVCIILSFISLSLLSKRFSDRALIFTGCIGMVSTYTMFFVYSFVLYQDEENNLNHSWLLPVFCINVGMLTLSLPYVWVSQASLFSKITSIETQAFNQGIRLSAMGFGQILGPIWAASMATVERTPIMIGVDLGLMCLITTMVVVSYKHLVPPKDLSSSPVPTVTSERTHLLSNGEVNHAVAT